MFVKRIPFWKVNVKHLQIQALNTRQPLMKPLQVLPKIFFNLFSFRMNCFSLFNWQPKLFVKIDLLLRPVLFTKIKYFLESPSNGNVQADEETAETGEPSLNIMMSTSAVDEDLVNSGETGSQKQDVSCEQNPLDLAKNEGKFVYYCVQKYIRTWK